MSGYSDGIQSLSSQLLLEHLFEAAGTRINLPRYLKLPKVHELVLSHAVALGCEHGPLLGYAWVLPEKIAHDLRHFKKK